MNSLKMIELSLTDVVIRMALAVDFWSFDWVRKKY